jgi:hypothetical protein
VDIRSSAAGTKIWEFVVRTNVPGETVALAVQGWAGTGVELTLVDVDGRAVRALANGTSYSFRTGAEGAERRFRLVARQRGRL